VGLAWLAASSAGQGAPAACAGAEHRQFDFWIGDWQVHAGEALAGRNRIEPILGGCALLESWEGASGSRGVSLNAYSSGDGQWHQTWVDGQGERLELAGGWDEATATMTLAGAVPDREGVAVRHEITWQRRADGTVRQRWRLSHDDGATWSEVFDGVYARGAAP
jgi:hypothetical protein